MRELDRLLDQLQIAAIKAGREIRRLEAADIRTAKRLEGRGFHRWHLRWLAEMAAPSRSATSCRWAWPAMRWLWRRLIPQ